MRRFQPALAVLCVLMLSAPVSIAQDRTPTLDLSSGVLHWYKPSETPALDMSNSSRLDQLLRAGNIYLSLKDAIALTLENNLDIARARYGPMIAQTDLQRAKAGGALRGVNTNVIQGASSAGAGLLLNAFSGGASSGSTSGSTSVNGVISQLGPTIPTLDPMLTGTISWGHATSPQTTPFLYGTTALVQTQKLANFTLTQGFLTGGQAALSYSNAFTDLNSGRPDINPSTISGLDLFVTQPLLQGFGFAVNNRQIRVAKNNLQVSDLAFQQQVIVTVAAIVNLYWDLVSFNQNVKVAERALSVSQKLLEDNKKQVEVGTLAPIAIVQADAEIAARQQDLIVAQTQVLQQETIIKNVLTRSADPAIAAAHIIPTDSIRIPETEAVQPIQDLIAAAIATRPELAQSRIGIENSRISVKADRNALLPSLNGFVDLTNHAQAGIVNPLPPLSSTGASLTTGRSVDPFFVGGYGTVLGQLFGRNFPDYRVGVQLNIPLRNRAAQADYARDSLTLRQSEIDVQTLTKQIAVDVQNAVIGMQQARIRYNAAVKQRVLEEQTVDAEKKKYALGASTLYLVIQTERDLATAQGSEVTALGQYAHARVALEAATGQVLGAYGVDIEEAKTGRVSAPPAPLPVLQQGGGNAEGAPVSRKP